MSFPLFLKMHNINKLFFFISQAQNAKFAVHGLQFIREMSTFLKEQQESLDQIERGVLQVISSPHYGLFSLIVAPAQFGTRLDAKGQFAGEVALADPLKACTPLQNGRELNGKVVVVRRGECMFEQKARHAQRAGALSLVVIDNQKGTSADSVPTFIMSEANDEDNEPIYIPSVFLFHTEGQLLLDQLFYYPKMVVRLAAHTLSHVYCFEQFLYRNPTFLSQQFPIANQFIVVAADKLTLRLNFLFGDVDVHSVPEQKQAMVERNVEWIEYGLHFPNELHSDGAGGELHRKFTFLGHVRALAYSLLGYPNTLSSIDMLELRQLVKHLRIDGNLFEEKTKRREKSMLPVPNLLASKISVRSIICRFQGAPGQFSCSEFPFLSQKAI